MTFSLFILLAGSFLCSWAVLRTVGNERERRVREIEARFAAEVAAAAEQAAANPLGRPARHSPGKPSH